MEAIGSLLWSSDSKAAAAEPAPEGKPPSLEELARLIKEEASARRAALSETQKQLDWRFVHFSDDFQRRLDELELRITETAGQGLRPLDGSPGQAAVKDPGSNLLPPFESIRRSLAEADARQGSEGLPALQQLEGKLALVETRVVELVHLEQALEAQLLALQQNAEARLGEAEAWLKHLDRRTADTEYQLGGRRGASGRLTPVERLTLEGGCGTVDVRSTTGSVRSGGSSCRHDGAASWKPPLSPLDHGPAAAAGAAASSMHSMHGAGRSVSMSTNAPTAENASPSSSLLSAGTSQQAALQASFAGFARLPPGR